MLQDMSLEEAKTILQNYHNKWKKVNVSLCYAIEMVLAEIQKNTDNNCNTNQE